jgi:hypothetical protein
MRYLLLLFLLCTSTFTNAKEEELPNAETELLPEVPELPMPVKSGENLEPDITIVRKGKNTVKEYRRNGQLFMVKVVPDIGPAYYLHDTNGDGKMDVRSNQLDQGADVNMWSIFEW